MRIRRVFRVSWRFAGFCVLSFTAIVDNWLRRMLPWKFTYRERALWAHRWAPRFLKLLHIEVDYSGTQPRDGVLAANHLSYLDIVVLAARQPIVFVAKSEVERWPLIGWLARCGGTLFVNRQRKTDVANLAPAFAPVITDGVVLGLFPEGTSTGGDRVLPFMSSLLEPAAGNGWQVSAAWLGYKLKDGSASEEVCYWGDMTFLPHLLNVFSKDSIQARVVYDQPLPPGLNRKEMAQRLRGQVQKLAKQYGPTQVEAGDVKRTSFHPFCVSPEGDTTLSE